MKYLKLIFLTFISVSSVHVFSEPLKTEQWLDFERAYSPQISPDGERVLYVRSGIDKINDRATSEIWQVKADATKHAFVVKGANIKWSPQGNRIAFIAPDSDGKPQLHVRYMDAEGLTSQITSLDINPRNYSWSPDGKHIAFVARTNETNTWSITLPGKPKGANWTADPVLIDTMHYRQDRVGITNTGYDHIFVVPSDGGTAKQITSGDWNVSMRRIGGIATGGNVSWSKDGESIFFDGQPRENGDMDVFTSIVYKVSLKTKEITSLTPAEGFYHTPVVSPNGKYIALVGAPEWASDTYRLNHLYLMDIDGKNIKPLVTDLSDSPDDLYWGANSKEILFTYNHHGSRHVHSTNLSGKSKSLTQGQKVVNLSSLSDDGVMALTISTPDNAEDVYLQKGTREANRLTNLNQDIFADVSLGEVKEIWYESSENTKIQAWLVMPPDFDDSKKYPLILSIHGGPHAMYNVGFNFAFQELAASGYMVLYTNPRGSTGYGADFANAIQGIYPGKRDGADLLSGLDAAIANGGVDSERLFVTGCSGGGVLTTYMVATSQRFKAAVARCTVSNWISMAGTSDVPAWVYRFHKKPFWEDPTDWIENSPLHMVGDVNTPVLLITGDKDLRTPFAEAEQYFSALKMRGIPTELIPMRGEYHGTGSIPSNWLRTQLYTKAWFERFDPTLQSEK
jgi:dipeptidyl aminopeptidase/acylaminoacyl peptidase